MSTTYIAFDKRTGQILSVHHGADDATDARKCCVQQHSEARDEHIEVITVLPQAVQQEKQYKVDVGRNVLIEVKANENGVGFGFGTIYSASLC